MRRLAPTFDLDEQAVKTVKTIEHPGGTYYIDECKDGSFVVSRDERIIYAFDDVESAEAWINVK